MSFFNFGYRIILAPQNKVEKCSLLYFVKDFVQEWYYFFLICLLYFPSGIIWACKFSCEKI